MTVRSLLPAARIMLAVALVAAAAVMFAHVPDKLQTWAPIPVAAEVGERAVGRDLAVTVHSVNIARAVTFTKRGNLVRMPAAGVWLVFRLDYEPLHVDATPVFKVVVSGRNYQSTLGTFRGAYAPGIPHRGVVEVELPDVPTEAVLKVANKTTDQWGNALDAPLDSQISLPIDIAALSIQDSLSLDELASQ